MDKLEALNLYLFAPFYFMVLCRRNGLEFKQDLIADSILCSLGLLSIVF